MVLVITLSTLGTTSNIVFGQDTSKGARFWYNVCKSPLVDIVISEDCGDLTSKHDPWGQGLSEEGWRVAKCIGGGALLLAAGHPELLSAGPAVGCGN